MGEPQPSRLFRAVMDTAGCAIVVADEEGLVREINREAERIHGADRQDVIGRSYIDHFVLPEEREAALERFAEALAGRSVRGFEVRIAAADGEIRTIVWNADRIDDEGRRVVLAVGVDISHRVADEARRDSLERERAAALDEIRRRGAWLRGLISACQDAVVSIDRRGRIVEFNPAAEAMFGYTAAEARGQAVNMLMAEPYASEHDEYIRAYERSHDARAIGRIRTVEARRRDGQRFPIELSVTEIAIDEEIRYGAFIRDVSERERLQSRLVERERLAAIGTTAAKLAHEIGNPLNNMHLNAQLLTRALERGDGLDEKLTSRIGAIIHEITRLKDLLDEFRAASRRQRLTLSHVSIAALFDQLEAVLGAELREAGVELSCGLADGGVHVAADAEKLEQVLLNLCRNAIEAMPEGGRLSLRAVGDDEQVIIEVEDTGPGLPDDIDVFEPFATTKEEGTGLGLAIVRQIVLAHRGGIELDSHAGRGTTIRIVLPRRPAPDPS